MFSGYRIIAFLAAFWGLSFYGLHAQSLEAFADTIPYEIRLGKIIISAEVSGKPTQFILDTGGRNFIVRDSLSVHEVKIQRNEMVSDANSLSSNLPKGSVSSLKIGNYYSTPNASMLVMPNNNFYRQLGVAGALGGEAFAHVVVTFHSKEKYITLSYPYRPKGVSRKDGAPMKMGSNFHAVIPVSIGSSTINTLFDTGMGGFMHIINPDYNSLKDKENITMRAEGAGVFYIGIGGIKNAKQEDVAKLDIAELKVGDKKFTNVGTLSQRRGTSIIGLDLLEYGNVMLDYPRGLFYFFPFDNSITDMGSITKIWDVKVLPIVDHFEVSAVVGHADLEIGERVWNINGTELDKLELSEMAVNDIFDQIKQDTAYILVGKDKQNLRKITIKKI